ncbi:MAG: NACHT domain-containing protein [Pedobacter sp.]|nr:MAG: NACHT domain-containing protein [Pedobacter sp.]
MTDASTLNRLKQLILIKTGLKLISPSDCKAISSAIQKELNKSISETTLKRLFGFASSNTRFSKFTINTLSEFASPPSELGDFVATTNAIDKIATNARQITKIMLQNVKCRCSVPYELTIPRKFAEHDFNYFRNSNHSFTAFIAQPGYGKTMLLAHLIEKIITDPSKSCHNDLTCYFDATLLFDPEQHQISLVTQIKSRIGLSPETDLIKYFDSQYEQSGVRLILVIDGFSELVLNKFSKHRIFDSLVELISTIGESNAVKIVLSFRPTIWNRFFERIRHAHFLKRKWFAGSYYYKDYNSNVPPLSEEELELVIEKMNPGKFEMISPNLKSQLKFPFHIQWYYRLKEQYPSFDSYTNITFYEIIDLFINEKIYRSNYATEKIVFCRDIVKLTNYSKKGDKISKSELMPYISIYKNAYMELLANGILMEEQHFHNTFGVEYVSFVHPHIFEYFLFLEILASFDQKLDRKFFQHIQDEYLGNQVRFQLLQWSVRHLIISGNLSEISNLFTLDLTNYEKNYLIYFIAENLNYRSIDYPELIDQISKQNLHRILIHEMAHFDFVDSCYKDAVECLLLTVDTDENAQFYHTVLAIIDCLSLDVERISARVKKMERFKASNSNQFVNSYRIISLIHQKLTGTAEETNEIIDLIESLKSRSMSSGENGDRLPSVSIFVEYLLLIIANVFYGTPQHLIVIVEAVLVHFPDLTKNKHPFSIYLFNILAVTHARTSPGKKADQMERILKSLYDTHNRKRPTSYAQSLMLILKAYQCKNKKNYDEAICIIQEAIGIFKRNSLFLYELWMYNLIIAIYTEMQEIEKVGQYNYTKLTRLEKHGIPFISLGYIELKTTS